MNWFTDIAGFNYVEVNLDDAIKRIDNHLSQISEMLKLIKETLDAINVNIAIQPRSQAIERLKDKYRDGKLHIIELELMKEKGIINEKEFDEIKRNDK